MLYYRSAALMAALLLAFVSCGESTVPQDTLGDEGTAEDLVTPSETVDDSTDDIRASECGQASTEWQGLIPGPCQDGYDEELEAKANRIERAHQIFVAAGLDVNKDISVALENEADRQAIEDFLINSDSWDFKAHSGKDPLDVITTNHKVAGLYAGVGIAANAYRYGVLRNQDYPSEEIERARQILLKSLDALHLAQEITGTDGVIARGFQRNDIPHNDVVTVPLFDEFGNPLPEGDKNNGTWRDDQSGKYPNYSWEDSVSRDMYVGWVTAQAATWEVIKDDDTIPEQYRTRLKADALSLVKELMKVRCHAEFAPDCYDLEIPDADGRITLHGWLNPQNLDGQIYLPGLENGFHAVMALGIVAAFAYITEDPDVIAYLNDDLIATREFPRIIKEHGGEVVDMGIKSNYSNYNMAYAGLWLCMRYLNNQGARDVIQESIGPVFYNTPGKDRQAAEIGYSYYDFIYAAGAAGLRAEGQSTAAIDETAVASGLNTLRDYHDAPYWDYGVILCPEAICTEDEPNVAVSDCEPEEGFHLTVLGCKGRNGDLITEEPIPFRLLGPSNYHWRSNPYRPNREGSGSALLPSVDFRIAYWTGRWARR
ncbi:MAG TPA: hypothetical protein PKK50_03035 [Myxococcota bacterium]|nr:hypothetical protein [Myxococcota bacterium]